MKNGLKIGMIICAVALLGFGIYAITQKNPSNSSDSQSQTVPVSTNQADVLKVQDNDNIRGDKNAPITIIDYSDYQCPYCVKFDGTMSQVMAAYPTQVKWIYRHYPLPFHKAAKGAAVAAEAAGLQGKYWEYSDKMVANSQADGTGLASDDLTQYAKDLGLDMDKFQKDRNDAGITEKINWDVSSADSLKIQGTPLIFIVDKDGKAEQLAGALSFDQMKSKIDALLK